MEEQGEQEDGQIAVQTEEQTDRQTDSRFRQRNRQTDRNSSRPCPQWGPSHAEASGTVGGLCWPGSQVTI